MNKTQRKERAEYRAMETAIQALQCVEAHEKVCIERWEELVIELKQLRETTNSHLAAWKKMSWLVAGTVFATASLHIALVLT
jgi:predicted neutral ceramidase superfamily lipid hydrolase|tara:strand:- start:2810 stop:3055 length:246 start_codon:yes stop_codon:yes gene_type:complete